MPTILISTIDDDGNTSLGSYSLCFPYYVAGKDYYAMLLECRNSSNTAQNLLKRPKCALNFLPDNKKYFKETVRLGYPGDTSKEKMKNLLFTLEDSHVLDSLPRPKIISESFQVFECTWMSDLENAYLDKAGNLEGYTFSGWFIDLNMTTLYSFNVMPAYDLVLYGEWIKNT
ncbi:MAG: hypothetical protein AB7E16_03690 [Candidatus Izemoplasmatales bacterium]